MARRCDRCSTVLGDQLRVCVECGSIQNTPAEADAIECENHPGERAVGCCVVCGKPVCGDCCRIPDMKVFCNNPQHEGLTADWDVLAVLDSGFAADMVTVNLHQRNVETRVFPSTSHAEAFWFPELRGVRVMIPKQKIAEGRRVLGSLGLARDSDDGSSDGRESI